MPEWYLVLGVLALLSVAGIFVKPLFPWTDAAPIRVELLLLAAATLALTFNAVRTAWLAPNGSSADGFVVRSLTAGLFLLQPVARLIGRLRYGLTPWRRRGELRFALPWPRKRTVWSERHRCQTDRLLELERDLGTRCMSVKRGGETDRWDIQVRLGPLGSARLRVAVEEHGQGTQLVRYRVWPRWSRGLPLVTLLLGTWIGVTAAHDLYVPLAIGAVLAFILLRAVREAGAGVSLVLSAIGDEVELDQEGIELPELIPDLRVARDTNGRQNGSEATVSLKESLERRG
jgi:hypothetical protein